MMTLLFFKSELSSAEEKMVQSGPKKNYLKAGLETLGLDLTFWSYDWYVKKAGWANISTYSIINNIERGFEWDGNSFRANICDHSSHGALSFSAARTNGLTFWESAPFAFLGSLIWEVALETNRPSINDQIMSTFGGITLGEIDFRIAELLIDESSRGLERVGREIFTFLVNPVLGFNRLIEGKSFRISGEPEKHYYDLRGGVGYSGHKPTTVINLEYKDAMEKEKISPYDYFRFSLLAKINPGGLKFEKVLSNGMLFGKKIDFKSSGKGLFGVFSHFDYIYMSGNNIGGVGLGPGLVLDFNLGTNSSLNLSTSFSGIFGAASSSFILKYGEEIFKKHGEHWHWGTGNNSYYFGPGILYKLNLELKNQSFGSIYTEFSHHWINSLFGTNAHERTERILVGANCNLFKWSRVGVEYEVYFKKGTYRDYAPIYRTIPNYRFFCGFNF